MPTNDFLPFASGTDPNVLSQSAYAALSARTGGFVSGTASSVQFNKVWRQAANMASAWGGVVTIFGRDALDDGDVAALTQALLGTIRDAANSNVLFYATPGTYSWICPANVTRVRVKIWGAGGGGGGSNTTNTAGAGGNGGGYTEGVFTVTPGTTYTITVGTGGSAGPNSGTAGTAGGSSSFGSLATATGGGAGGGSVSVGNIGGAGVASGTVGTGTGGQININGGTAANSYSGIWLGSAGAGSFGTSASAVSIAGGISAVRPGGGGGGGANGNAGAAGAPGLVIVEY